ncbi:unnamed protein product [Phyllotreta striolata]|uniref:Choline/ethanolamine kinase n=1 Tax=Phyllotreta striolata TaxID=444603 RepID=A0A9N9TRN4_PHYSR|nr:unnamed protein product [Phyllotreta striolata]
MLDIVPKNQSASGDPMEMRELAARICRDYLQGAWKKVTPKNIGFKHITGGLSNFLYQVSLPDFLASESPKDKNEPRDVLIRIYGQTHGEGALEALITESVVFTLLSEQGLGPKLLGIFPGGRIEQYINARPLLSREIADEKLSVQIAKKMAAIHSMEVPLHKEPVWLWNTIDKYLQTFSSMQLQVPDTCGSSFSTVELKAEAEWLRTRLEAENSPVVFCHNDLQGGNILLQNSAEDDSDEDELVIIDYEYCAYNYRAFDIANHFVEWVYDYRYHSHPYFKENWSNYPSEKQRLTFIRTYLKEVGSRENPKKVMREVEAFTMVTHLLWTAWALTNAGMSNIPFGYWEFASARLKNYYQIKQKYTSGMQLKRKMDELTMLSPGESDGSARKLPN